MRCDNDLNQWIRFFAIIKKFLMRYRSLFANIFAIFNFFNYFFETQKISTNKLFTVFNQEEAIKQ